MEMDCSFFPFGERFSGPFGERALQKSMQYSAARSANDSAARSANGPYIVCQSMTLMGNEGVSYLRPGL